MAEKVFDVGQLSLGSAFGEAPLEKAHLRKLCLCCDPRGTRVRFLHHPNEHCNGLFDSSDRHRQSALVQDAVGGTEFTFQTTLQWKWNIIFRSDIPTLEA